MMLTDTDKLLGQLRNAHGQNFDQMREVRLAAADHIEALTAALASLRKYAEEQGIDTAAHPCGRPLPEIRAELLKRVDRLAAFAHNYWTQVDVGPEREWGANLYDIIRTAPREARA